MYIHYDNELNDLKIQRHDQLAVLNEKIQNVMLMFFIQYFLFQGLWKYESLKVGLFATQSAQQ